MILEICACLLSSELVIISTVISLKNFHPFIVIRIFHSAVSFFGYIKLAMRTVAPIISMIFKYRPAQILLSQTIKETPQQFYNMICSSKNR